MRLLLVSAVAAVLTAAAVPSLAASAVDTTGTTYSTDRVVVRMTFPVAGSTSLSDTYLTCRSGCSRKHMGQDLMGAKMTPLVATFNGTISSLKQETTAGGGNYVVLNGDNGWSAIYLHVNNDTPGTDDGRGTGSWAFPKGIAVGVRVMAGQLIGWRGDSGNAESTGAHLHFELRKGSGWSGTVYNAHPSLVAARRLRVPLPSGPHPDQSLMRSASGAVFVLDGPYKRPVSAGVLVANRLPAATALTLSAAESMLYRTAAALPLRDGALVRDPAGTAWRVAGRTRYPVTPLEGQRVTPVAAADLLGLAVVEPPLTPTAGMLVRTGGKVYAVAAEGVLRPASSYAMATWGWTAEDVVDLPALEVPVDPVDPLAPLVVPLEPVFGPPLGVRDGTLVSISAVGPAVVSRGIVRRLWDAREITAYGYAGKPRLTIPSTLVAGLPVGEVAGPLYAARYR